MCNILLRPDFKSIFYGKRGWCRERAVYSVTQITIAADSAVPTRTIKSGAIQPNQHPPTLTLNNYCTSEAVYTVANCAKTMQLMYVL